MSFLWDFLSGHHMLVMVGLGLGVNLP
jgi:hypothetical protein